MIPLRHQRSFPILLLLLLSTTPITYSYLHTTTNAITRRIQPRTSSTTPSSSAATVVNRQHRLPNTRSRNSIVVPVIGRSHRRLAAAVEDSAEDLLDFDWQEASDALFIDDERPVILYDGICKFCNGSVNYALDNDSKGKFRFASLQSTIGRALLLRSNKKTDDLSSIVVVTSAQSYFKSDAVLYIARRLDGNAYLPFVGRWSTFVPKMMRNVVYDFVSRNRYRWGESDSCRVDLMEFEDRFISDPCPPT